MMGRAVVTRGAHVKPNGNNQDESRERAETSPEIRSPTIPGPTESRVGRDMDGRIPDPPPDDIFKVTVPYGGEAYEIGLRRMELALKDGATMVHFQVVDIGELDAPLFELGRRVLLDSLHAAEEKGEVDAALVKEVEGLIEHRQALPKKGRRIGRQVLPSWFRDTDPTKLSVEVDKRAARMAQGFKNAYGSFIGGGYPKLKDMTAGEFLDVALEMLVAQLLREVDYYSLLMPEERVERTQALAKLRDEKAGAEEKERARQAYEQSEQTLDERYAEYYELRRELMALGVPPCEVRRRVENLRKSKRRPELKGVVRLLNTENMDVDCYRAYNEAMVMVSKKLRARGQLDDLPSQGLFAFMHWPHAFLSGIVPALHPIGPLLLQSKRFREAVAAHAQENLDGQGGKSPETICNLYGVILAAAEVYAGEVHELRGKDMMRAGKVKHQHGGRTTREASFAEDPWNVDEYASGAGGGRAAGQSADRDMGRGALDNRPLIMDEDIAQQFGEDAKYVEAYLDREGLGGRSPQSVTDLARLRRVHRTTIWRWARRGKEILEQKGAELGLSV